MNNNDILVRLRYALDIKDQELVEIFHLGDVELDKETVRKLLTKKESVHLEDQEYAPNEYLEMCDNAMLDSFLNGFITYKRGRQENSGVEPQRPSGSRYMNNALLKKVKIALSLTSEDVLDILADAGVFISKSELSAVLRKEGQRNFKVCGDRYARNFLKGLALRFREDF